MPKDDFEAYDPLTPFVNGCIKFAYICFIGLIVFAICMSIRAAQSYKPVYSNELESIKEDIVQLRQSISLLANIQLRHV